MTTPTSNLSDFIDYSPFFAAVEGLPENEAGTFYGRYDRLPEPLRKFLLDSATSEALASMEREGLFPATHRTAIAKIVAFIVLGDVAMASIEELLTKLTFSSDQAARVAVVLRRLIEPAMKTPGMNAPLPTIQPMPILNRPSETGPKPLAPNISSSKVPERNIIDLRRKTE